MNRWPRRLAGFHIHDVQFPDGDHAAPGTGTIDYAALKPFVKPEHIKVFELSPALPVEAVKRGVAHVKKIWGERMNLRFQRFTIDECAGKSRLRQSVYRKS